MHCFRDTRVCSSHHFSSSFLFRPYNQTTAVAILVVMSGDGNVHWAPVASAVSSIAFGIGITLYHMTEAASARTEKGKMEGNLGKLKGASDGSGLKDAPEELKNDREFVLQAVKKDGTALQYASKELQNDREIVMQAVKQNGSALQFASEELQNDAELKALAARK